MALTVALVPTAIKQGVSKLPWAVIKVARRALPIFLWSLNWPSLSCSEDIGRLYFNLGKMSRKLNQQNKWIEPIFPKFKIRLKNRQLNPLCSNIIKLYLT